MPDMNQIYSEIKANQEAYLTDLTMLRKSYGDLDSKLTSIHKEQEEKINAAIDKSEAKLSALLNTIGKSQKEKDVEEKGLKTRAMFKALIKGVNSLSDAERKTVVSINDDETAGFLMPVEYVQDILRDTVEVSPIRQYANYRQTTASRVSRPRKTGSISAKWREVKNTAPDATNPKYGSIIYDMNPLDAVAVVEEESLNDLSYIEQDIREDFAEQFALSEGSSFLNGSGVGEPLGILKVIATPSGTSNAVVNVTDKISVVTSNATSLTFDDLVNVESELKSEFLPNAAWFVNRKVFAALRKLKDENGSYLLQSPSLVGTPSMVWGYPVIKLPDMPSTVSTGNIAVLFGDMRKAYTVIDRLDSFTIRRDMSEPFPRVKFFGTRRLTGQVENFNAIKAISIK